MVGRDSTDVRDTGVHEKDVLQREQSAVKTIGVDQQTLEQAISIGMQAHQKAHEEYGALLQAADMSEAMSGLVSFDEDDLRIPSAVEQQLGTAVERLLRTHYRLYPEAKNPDVQEARDYLVINTRSKNHPVTTTQSVVVSDEAVTLYFPKVESAVNRVEYAFTWKNDQFVPWTREVCEERLDRLVKKVKGAELEYNNLRNANNINAVVNGNIPFDASTLQRAAKQEYEAQLDFGWALLEFTERFKEEALDNFLKSRNIADGMHYINLAERSYLGKE